MDSHNCPKCKNATESQEGYAKLKRTLDGKNRIGKAGGTRMVEIRISFPVMVYLSNTHHIPTMKSGFNAG